MTNTIPLSQLAYQQIKQMIVSLRLPPGSVIDEAELREDLGLGRTPIREALQRLAAEKLVEIVPRRGTFVSDIGITDLQRLFEVRLVLEGLAARLATQRGTAEQWLRMRRALDEASGLESPVDNETLIGIDGICHEIIYEAADNEFLRSVLSTMYALSQRLWYYALSKMGHMHEVILEHEAILDALQSGDADRSARLIQQHIQSFQVEIQQAALGISASNGSSQINSPHVQNV